MKYIHLPNVIKIQDTFGERPNVLLPYWYENLHLARRLWIERVKPNSVYLDNWNTSCGTKACFGGWLATWPEFCLLGVANQSIEGELIASKPSSLEKAFATTKNEGRLANANLPSMLFGESCLFNHSDAYNEDTGRRTMSQHAEVIKRIDDAIDRLSVELGLLDQESI